MIGVIEIFATYRAHNIVITKNNQQYLSHIEIKNELYAQFKLMLNLFIIMLKTPFDSITV